MGHVSLGLVRPTSDAEENVCTVARDIFKKIKNFIVVCKIKDSKKNNNIFIVIR
jgi:hypothetical protein